MLRSYQLSTHKGYSDKFFIHFIKIIKNIHDVLHLLIQNKIGRIIIMKNTFYVYPPIHLHFIFEISSLRNLFLNLIFCLFRTGFLQATQAVKIKFEIDKKSSSKIKFENQVRKSIS